MTNVWVTRDGSLNITGVFAVQQSFTSEQLASTDAGVTAFVAKASVPGSVTRRQYYMQGVVAGWFTQAQALALITTGTLPPSVISFVSSLPAGQQFAANMYLIGAATYERNNPLLIQLTTAGGITSAFMDAFFTSAALL